MKGSRIWEKRPLQRREVLTRKNMKNTVMAEPGGWGREKKVTPGGKSSD